MKWNEILTIVGVTSATQVIVILIVGYASKSMFGHFLQMNIESKKKELEKDFLRFSKLNEKRGDAIEAYYIQLILFKEATERLLIELTKLIDNDFKNFNQVVAESAKWKGDYQELNKLFLSKRIFFSPDLNEKILLLHSSINGISDNVIRILTSGAKKTQGDPAIIKESIVKIETALSGGFKTSLNIIFKDFQSVLGV